MHYAVGVDGIALVLIGMTAVLMPVVILASWHDADPASQGWRGRSRCWPDHPALCWPRPHHPALC